MASGSELTVLNPAAAHFSRIFFVSKHLFSSKSLAAMHALNPPSSVGQNFFKITCLGALSSSLGKLIDQLGRITYKITRSSTSEDFLEVPPKLCTMFSIGIYERNNYNFRIRGNNLQSIDHKSQYRGLISYLISLQNLCKINKITRFGI